jgi:hypothetical protein
MSAIKTANSWCRASFSLALKHGIYRVLKNLEVWWHKLASLKTALMQELLTGRKRVTSLLEPETTHRPSIYG